MEEDGGSPETGAQACRESDVSLGEHVRISKEKMRFAKAARQTFSTETFRVAKLIERRTRAVHELDDLNGAPIDGYFYREELTPIRITDRTFYKISLLEQAFFNIVYPGVVTVRISTLGCLLIAR